MGELCDGDTVSSSSGRNHDPEWLRRLTVNIGFREFNSFRHFIGTDEQTQRAINHNQVENHQLLFDIGINYQLSRRWSIIADVPVQSSPPPSFSIATAHRSFASWAKPPKKISSPAWIGSSPITPPNAPKPLLKNF